MDTVRIKIYNSTPDLEYVTDTKWGFIQGDINMQGDLMDKFNKYSTKEEVDKIITDKINQFFLTNEEYGSTSTSGKTIYFIYKNE